MHDWNKPEFWSMASQSLPAWRKNNITVVEGLAASHAYPWLWNNSSTVVSVVSFPTAKLIWSFGLTRPRTARTVLSASWTGWEPAGRACCLQMLPPPARSITCLLGSASLLRALSNFLHLKAFYANVAKLLHQSSFFFFFNDVLVRILEVFFPSASMRGNQLQYWITFNVCWTVTSVIGTSCFVAQ